MERDGWKFLQNLEYDYYGRRTIKPLIIEKQISKGGTRLRVERYFDPEEQWLCSIVTKQGTTFLVGTGTCADIDQQGRLIFGAEGKLFVAKLRNGKVGLEQLADFNRAKPTSLKAPAWATRW
jgi:hypothetical protein